MAIKTVPSLLESSVKAAYFYPGLSGCLGYLPPIIQDIFNYQISAFELSGNIEKAFLFAAEKFEGMAFYMIENNYVKKNQELFISAFYQAVIGGNLKLVKYLRQIIGDNLLKRQSFIPFAGTSGNFKLIKYFEELNEELKTKAAKLESQAKVLSQEGLHENNLSKKDSANKLSSNARRLYQEAAGLELNVKSLDGDTLLHSAAESGNLELVKYLVEEKGLDINATTITNKITVLHCAANSGNLELFLYLLNKGLDIKTVAQWNYTNLHFAARSGNLELFQYIERAGLDIMALTSYNEGVLHFAARSGNLELVKYLVEEKKLFVKLQTVKLETPLHRAVESGNLELVKYLVKKNEEEGVNLKDIYTSNGESLLHIAAKSGNPKLVKYFVREKEFDVFATTNSGKTPLYYAAETGYFDSMYSILKGSDPRNREASEIAIYESYKKILTFFPKHFPISSLPQLSQEAAQRLGKLNKDFETISFERYEKLLEEKNKNLQKEIKESDTITSIE